MTRKTIRFDDLNVNIHRLWGKQWLLLTAGDFSAKKFNCMTVAWGSLGTMWNKPFSQVVVRESRYTLEFMEKYTTFTLCVFPGKLRPALTLLGSKSGRDGDKIKESGLTPVAAEVVEAPVYKEAELAIECRKMYKGELSPAGFLSRDIAENYPKGDYHRVFFGEVVAITGTDGYTGK